MLKNVRLGRLMRILRSPGTGRRLPQIQSFAKINLDIGGVASSRRSVS